MRAGLGGMCDRGCWQRKDNEMRDARVFPGHRGVVQKEGVPCRPPKEDICAQHYPVAIETSSGRWVAGEGGGSGRGGEGPARGGRELAPAVRALSPLEPELAEGDPEDTEPRALRQAPAPPATTEQVAKQPFRPWPGTARAVGAHLSPAWCPAGLR